MSEAPRRRGKPLGSASTYYVGAVIGGSEILAIEKKETEKNDTYLSSVYFSCGSCGGNFEVPYTTLSAIAKHTNKITCGCESETGTAKVTSERELAKIIRQAGEKAMIRYLKSNPKKTVFPSLAKAIEKLKSEMVQVQQQVVPIDNKVQKEVKSLLAKVLMSSNGYNNANKAILRKAQALLA